jgi:hypothetical protein
MKRIAHEGIICQPFNCKNLPSMIPWVATKDGDVVDIISEWHSLFTIPNRYYLIKVNGIGPYRMDYYAACNLKIINTADDVLSNPL